MKIIDNKNYFLIDELKQRIDKESSVYISCRFFTAFALYELLQYINKAKQVNILLSITEKDEEAFRLLQSKEEHHLNFQLNRKYKVAKVISFIKRKAEIRKGATANQNILIVENPGETEAFFLTPLNLDTVSLGKSPAEGPIFINAVEDVQKQYLELFKSEWKRSKEKLNTRILNNLELGVKNFSGEAIYKYTIREIFEYATIDERADEKLQKVGFKDSKVWHLLYNFQKDAVIGAIEKIESYGGCIIADSVGLGKTFEALAIMKYYLLRNDRILVLAPKKLRDNWTVYQLNDKRNILAEDRLNYDVLNHTDLSREKGKSGDIDLETINWGNYDLVVIDESHNFRNNPKKRGMTRYQRLMQDIIRANIRTKVLMLSATPVNNRMNDLKNQIAFITEGDDQAFAVEGIDSIAQVMRDAQQRFTRWAQSGDPDQLNVNRLMEQLDGAYFRILDMLTIARSRKHIEKYYDTAEIGKFPERLPPSTKTPPIDTDGKFQDIEQIYEEISTLTLAAYAPLAYVSSDKREEYKRKYDMETSTGRVFHQTDREQSLIYLMRVNLLKRLESSIHAFKLTISKLIDYLEANIKQIEEHQNGEWQEDISITEIDIDDTELEDLLVGGKTKVLLQDMDLIRWKQDLSGDKDTLVNLMGSIELITPAYDAKLLELKKLISNKVAKPINQDNKKMLIFTAFSDTANYLYKQLADWLKQEKGLYSALVTGTGANKTNLPDAKTELTSVLTHFSPLSKRRNEVYPDAKAEIDILFATDCISEGQNLQDCDYLVNYDIHWNPVRIIQRFGRIDRIGSSNDKIQLVNFFPNMELDRFIDLIKRVKGRMVMLDVSATGEDNVIAKDSNEMQDLEYRKRQLKQLQNQVMDLEDVKGNISITDLTFNDFKMDLEKSSEGELAELENIPPASHAVVPSNLQQIKKGAIFCFRDKTDTTQPKLKNNIIHPFFLVYRSLDGTTKVLPGQGKQALDYFRKLCMGNNKTHQELIAHFDRDTKEHKNMKDYTRLMEQALDDLKQEQTDIGLASLAKPGGTVMKAQTTQAEAFLELVSYLIIA